MKHFHHLLFVIAVGIAHTGTQLSVTAQEWTPHELPSDSDPDDDFGWGNTDLTSSADGSVLVITTNGNAAPEYGAILVSTDSGETWEIADAPRSGWSSVAVSADGSMVVAAGYLPGIYTSADSGTTWIPRFKPDLSNVEALASSADGVKLVAVANQVNLGFGIYQSTDSGETWELVNPPPGRADGNGIRFHGVASSADGSRLVAIANREDPNTRAYTAEVYSSRDAGAELGTHSVARDWR